MVSMILLVHLKTKITSPTPFYLHLLLFLCTVYSLNLKFFLVWFNNGWILIYMVREMDLVLFVEMLEMLDDMLIEVEFIFNSLLVWWCTCPSIQLGLVQGKALISQFIITYPFFLHSMSKITFIIVWNCLHHLCQNLRKLVEFDKHIDDIVELCFNCLLVLAQLNRWH